MQCGEIYDIWQELARLVQTHRSLLSFLAYIERKDSCLPPMNACQLQAAMP